MIVMQHSLGLQDLQGVETTRLSTMILYGDPVLTDEELANPSTKPSYSAMARTVGIPAALGVCLLAEGGIKSRGVFGPTKKEIYSRLLPALAEHGVVFEETETGKLDLQALQDSFA